MIFIHRCRCTGCGAVSRLLRCLKNMQQRNKMTDAHRLSPAKRKRLLKTLGPCPAGYTNDDLERFLDLLYGMYSHVYTMSKVNYLRTVLRIRSAESTSLCDDRVGLKTNKIPGHHHACLPSELATTIRTRTPVNYLQSSPTRVDQSPAGSENCALASDPE